jgi:hypothetical protein
MAFIENSLVEEPPGTEHTDRSSSAHRQLAPELGSFGCAVVDDSLTIDPRETWQGMCCQVTVGHDMPHFPSSSCHMVSDDPAMASPPEALRAHNYTGLSRGQLA